MLKLEPSYIEAVKILSTKLGDRQYCIRGTTSLVLQNIDMGVDDIDFICDSKTALETNSLLAEYLVTEVSLKETPKFRSYFGEFNIGGVKVECAGEFQAWDSKKGLWSRAYDGSSYNTVIVDGVSVKVTKPEDELEMFLAMGRFNAYQKIKKQINSVDSKQPSLL